MSPVRAHDDTIIDVLGVRRTRGRGLGLIASVLLLSACGAKTGLYVDDGGVPNSPDAEILDAGPDAPDAPDICVEVPFDGEPVRLDLLMQAEVGRADITFLIDKTASMGEETDRIRAELRDRIAPAIRTAIPDSQLAVATFADFPVNPYGAREDTPFELRLPMTPELASVQATVNSIELTDGRDVAESQVEALYQLTTGEGLPPYVPPSAGCPRGGQGYACVRPDALPVILLFTDNEFHNGPRGANPYVGFRGNIPHTYADAVRVLQATGSLVIGFDSGAGAATGHLNAVARDTDAVVSGEPSVQGPPRRSPVGVPTARPSQRPLE